MAAGPAQQLSAAPRGNMVDRMGMRPGRIYFVVVHLTWRKSSWLEDANRCLRLWGRLRLARVAPPRLMPLMARWAALLLEYADAYGMGARGLRWPLGALKQLSETNGADVRSFNVLTWRKAEGICAVSGRTNKSMVTYVTEYVDGRRVVSAPIGGRTLETARRNIQRALNRHRGRVRREKFREMIRRAQWPTNSTKTRTTPSSMSPTCSPTSSPTTPTSSSTKMSRKAVR